MSYYDDIGVPSNASADEIHDRYRLLVRLFHPDQHADPGLKSVAEAQLRRFNHIYSILSEPDRRRHYNAEQAAAAERMAPIIIHAPRPLPNRAPLPWGTISWVGAVAASAALIFWLSNRESMLVMHPGASAMHYAESDTPSVSAAPLNVTGPATLNAMSQLRQQLQTALQQRDEAWKLLTQARLPSGASPKPAEGASSRIPMPPPPAFAQSPTARLPETPAMELPPTLPAAAVAASLPIAVPQQGHFAGMWFWAKPTIANKNKSLYPPEFIETTIVEQNGSLHGRYRARYRVADRAISPNVNFEFDGKATGTGAQLSFSGDGGARGEVKMKMISDTAMELRWTATDMGRSLGLAAGTAVLVKKAE